MKLRFRQLRKLWLLYLFLLFFAFFMFALSINIYLQSLHTTDLRLRKLEAARFNREKPPRNVVAHYIGAGNLFGNITKEEYNVNDFKPVPEEGAMGRPVIIPARDNFKMQRLFKVHSFNILASDRIPLNRTLKDYRMNECKVIEYDIHKLPTTTVIIVFHNEAWSVLLRTIWSVINRSPSALLKEIILIDDASEKEYLQQPLEKYIVELPVRTKLFRLGFRQGLVPARLLGAANAEGDVLTFLDAHCECSRGWLEPILARIKENRKSVVCPVIDIISDDNFGYTKTFENHWGAFNWQLSFRWFSSNLKNDEGATKPIPTPGMAGGLFSIDKSYFFDMGGYDEAMKIWGGENVEMSFRIWQCGGSIEISPCSHVGHVFRKSTPYTFPGGVSGILSNNLARAALVWMDKWQDFFFMYSSVSMELRHSLNITDRLALRKRLNCHSFEWYLKNIWPNHFFPADDRLFGKIIWLNGETELAKEYEKIVRNIPDRFVPTKLSRVFDEIQKHNDISVFLDLDRDSCLRSLDEREKSFATSGLSPLEVGNCLPDGKLQDMFVIKPNGQFMTNENMCLDYYEHKNSKLKQGMNVQLFGCTDHARQHWHYHMDTQQIVHKESELCLTINPATDHSRIVSVEKCKRNEITQKWGLVPLPWKFH